MGTLHLASRASNYKLLKMSTGYLTTGKMATMGYYFRIHKIKDIIMRDVPGIFLLRF